MKRIAITPPEMLPEEASMIMKILDAGWDMVHIRHPQATRRDIRNLIEAISQKYHKRLRLHGHFELTNHFNLGGLQLNHRCPNLPANYSGPYSRSCHSIEEANSSTDCDYVTLSPIFTSISKSNYPAVQFDFGNLSPQMHGKIIALGGITPERFNTLDCNIFGGFAVLGYLFEGLTSDWRPALEQRLLNFD